MKAQTYNTNALGTVINPSSATGFRLEDDHGGHVEANVVDGLLVVEYVSAELTYTQHNLDPVCKKCRGSLMPTPIKPEDMFDSDGERRFYVPTTLDTPLSDEECNRLSLAYPDSPPAPIRTIAELVKATAAMRPEHHCIWPDCGHDANTGCDGRHCPAYSGSGS